MIRGMKRTVKVAISLPQELLSQVDRVRRRRGESRSQYFRDAAAARLTVGAESSVEVYRRGYVTQPESPIEVEAATQSAVALLASEPWE
jgi:metal-responsive CopG/Arc/MetJ family transcriptional regulator